MHLTATLVVALAILGGPSANAAPIPGLFNTGVDDTGKLLKDGKPEQHYALVSQPADYTLNVIRNNHGYPIPPWVSDDHLSAWIAPADAATVLQGNYDYKLTIDLTGFNPTTAVIHGKWATDNSGTIYVNGVATSITSSDFSQFSRFSIKKGFVSGINTLDFVVNNAAPDGENPSGLVVQMTGTVQPDTAEKR